MVQILLATYNGECFVKEQIESLMKQTYNNIQVIVRDDGSSDETVNILNKLKTIYSDKLFIVKDKKKCGSSKSNFMQLLKHATADYVMFCDQDDFWFSEKVHTTLKAMKKYEELNPEKPVLIYSNYEETDSQLIPIKSNKKNNQIYNEHLDVNHLLVQNYVTGCTMMINKLLYQNTLEYRDEMLMHDWWIALYAATFGKIIHIQDVLMYYRQHQNNVVGAINVRSLSYIIRKALDNNTKNSMQAYLRQADAFYKLYENSMSLYNKKIYKEFLNIITYGKLKRVLLLLKRKYLKSTLMRIIGQVLYV